MADMDIGVTVGGGSRPASERSEEEVAAGIAEGAYEAYEEVEPYIVHMDEAWTISRRIIVAVPDRWAEYKAEEAIPRLFSSLSSLSSLSSS